MHNLYEVNGLIFWTEKELMLRDMFEKYFVQKLKENLKSQNRAFDFHKFEAPLLTPVQLINPNYTSEDVWVQQLPEFSTSLVLHYVETPGRIEADKDRLTSFSATNNIYERMLQLREDIKAGAERKSEKHDFMQEIIAMARVYEEMYPVKGLVLRPETTMGSYAYAKHLMNPHNEIKVMPPLVVYQHGKSFRREQDQPTKFMRLKEFYQLEFQIIYSPSTKNDYSITLLPAVKNMISEMIGTCRLEDSDRIPSYAEWTKDVVCEKTNMEVCSISKRTDFEGMNVLEVAIGTDRCVYNFEEK